MTSPEEKMYAQGDTLDLTKHGKSFQETGLDSLRNAKDMARDTALGRDRMVVVPTSVPMNPAAHSITIGQPNDINQQILELKKEQEMQKQMLWHTFQEKTKQLELQHKLELEHKYQFVAHSNGVFQELREQRLAAEEQQQRERREREAMMKRKENCSANASPQVKQILMSFLMNKKHAATGNGTNTASPYRNRSVVKSSSGESLPAGTVTSSHPYKIPQPPSSIVSKYDSDFPLRKTASEPNLLKIRLKQSVIERKARAGPLAARRHERLLHAAQRRQLKQQQNSTLANCTNTSDSGPNSPPTMSTGSRGSPTSAPIQEENEEPQYQSIARSSINDLSLFSSPSMPNISLGRPHLQNTTAGHSPVANLAMITVLKQQQQQQQIVQPMVASGAPTYYNLLTSSHDHHHHGGGQISVVGGSTGTVADLPPQAHSTTTPTTTTVAAAAAAAASIKSLQISSHLSNLQHQMQQIYGQPAITDSQVANARLNKQGHRPLGRTQSAPLPLGHPILTGAVPAVNTIAAQTHYENSDAERQAAYEHQHLLLTQKIRQTVLTRSGGRETSLCEEEPGEVIDLTDKKQPPRTVPASSILSNVVSSTTSLSDDISGSSSGSCLSLSLRQNRDQEYLQQQREILFKQSLQMEEALARGLVRPLSRTLSSPLVHCGGGSCIPQQNRSPIDTGQSPTTDITPPVNLTLPHRRNQHSNVPAAAVDIINSHKITTGLAFDSIMLKHSCLCGNNSSHPEHSGRLQSIWARLIETGLANRCDRLRSRKATQDELQTVHTETHSMLFGSNQLNRQKFETSPCISFVRLSCGGVGVDLDTTWNEHHTAAAARMAVGCVIDLAFKTANGDIKNGFAVVRPPGHHAEANQAMGFCFFNSVAIAAKLLRRKLPEMKKILIIDWDVHHGNGTQQAFYDCPNVLYLSIHRHDDGNFFPGTGGPTECGTGSGLGYNVNISWSGGLSPPLGDAEYLAAFRTIVMPIATEFSPDIVLVSAGFDAAAGHPPPLGGYVLTSACYGYMTRQLMQLANGKIVLALEGGYDLPAICDSAQECVRALLGDEPPIPVSDTELSRIPCQNAIDTLQKTVAIQASHWPCVQRLAHTVNMSAVQALKLERDDSETTETVTAMAGLSMQPLRGNLSRNDSEEPMEQDDGK